MNHPGLLVLVPSEREAQVLASLLDHPRIRVARCGFGPVVAGIETAVLMNQASSVTHAILMGIAGTYCEESLPIGTAASFDEVSLWGLGVETRDGWQTAAEVGWGAADADGGFSVADTLPLESLSTGLVRPRVLTVSAAAGDPHVVRDRRSRFPDAVCEEMEGFAVAQAATRMGRRVSIVRGISNAAGDRDKSRWEIDAALQAASEIVLRFADATVQ